MDEQKITVYSVEGGEYNAKLASELKKIPEFEMPEWAHYVKTSSTKERPPVNADWWFIRASSILRQIYLKGTVGVGRLSTKYGSKLNRGMRPPIVYGGSKKVIRVILQQAEKAGFLETIPKEFDGKHGRKLTKKGKEFLDQAAAVKKE